MKLHAVGTELLRANRRRDGQRHMMKIKIASCNFANAS